MKLWIAMLLLAAAPSLAQAHDQPGAPTPTTRTAAPPAAATGPIVVQGQVEKKICRTETSTGSIMPVRVCRTETQIADQQEKSARYLDAVRQYQETQEHVRNLRNAP
jgi:hypothetical protein